MEPKVEVIWTDGTGGANAAGVLITCCNVTYKVTVYDFKDTWICPECGVKIRFTWEGVSYKIIADDQPNSS